MINFIPPAPKIKQNLNKEQEEKLADLEERKSHLTRDSQANKVLSKFVASNSFQKELDLLLHYFQEKKTKKASVEETRKFLVLLSFI